MPMGPLQMWSHLAGWQAKQWDLEKKGCLPFGQGNLFVFLTPLRRLLYSNVFFFVQCDRILQP